MNVSLNMKAERESRFRSGENANNFFLFFPPTVTNLSMVTSIYNNSSSINTNDNTTTIKNIIKTFKNSSQCLTSLIYEKYS